MKEVFFILALISTSINLFAQKKSGTICYQQTIVLTIDPKKVKQFTDPFEQFLLKAASGKKLNIYYKVQFDGPISNKIQTDECDSTIADVYRQDDYVYFRDARNKSETTFQYTKSKQLKRIDANPHREMPFSFTGKSKNILGYACKEIQYVEQIDNQEIRVKAFVTKQLPKSAGFEIFSNLDAAIIEMETNGRSLVATKIKIKNSGKNDNNNKNRKSLQPTRVLSKPGGHL